MNAHQVNITSIHDIMTERPDIEYITCHDIESFDYTPFPLARFPELHPNKGLIAPTYIVKIPQGQVNSLHGWIKVDNHIVSEFIPSYFSLTTQMQCLQNTPFQAPQKIKGRVAVLAMSCDACFGHRIYNVLGRLALLESCGIEYDYLFVRYDKPYMVETLNLWGIDPQKIIHPYGSMSYIEADELIIPSYIGIRMPEAHQYPVTWIPVNELCNHWGIDPKTVHVPYNTINQETDIIPDNIAVENYFLNWTPLCGSYFCPWVIEHLRNKFLPLTKNLSCNFSKKVFISRNDTTHRLTTNEDKLFALFEKYGFERYALANMPLVEQVALFNQADIIVATHGSGLNHLMFCKPGTTVIEIFQARSDCCFYYLSQVQKLHHYCIQTMDFTNIWGFNDTAIPLFIIQNFITDHLSLFE